MTTWRLPKKIYFLPNQDFQTIRIQILFPQPFCEEDIAKRILLPSMLMYLCQQYPTEEEFQKEVQRRYILKLSCDYFCVGRMGFFSFSFVIPTPEALGENILEKQFSLLEQIIYHPKVVDQGFDSFELEREKENLRVQVKNDKNNQKKWNHFRLCELVDDQGLFSACILNHSKQIDKVTPCNLYQYYLDSIYHQTPIIFAMGDISQKYISSILGKYFYPYFSKEVSIDLDYNQFLAPVNSNVQTIHEKSSFHDSSLSLAYKVQDMSESDFVYLNLIQQLLSSVSSRLLAKKLRDELEMIYSCRVQAYFRFGLLMITAYIDRNNKDIIYEKILEVIQELKDVNLIEPLLKNIKERERIQLIRVLDHPAHIFEDFIFQNLKIKQSLEEEYQIIMGIHAQDIAQFIDRLHLDTVYFLEEGSHESI